MYQAKDTIKRQQSTKNDGIGDDPIDLRDYVLIVLYPISFCNDAPKPKGKQTGEEERHEGRGRVVILVAPFALHEQRK